MTNRRHFYFFKINQNASAQNFSQNPPCPDKPGKPLFLRVHAVRHNNAFCNGDPASRFCCRIAPKLRLRGTKMLPFFCKTHPASRFCCRVAPKLRLRGTKMLPFCKTHPASTPGNRMPRNSDCAARRCCLFLQNSPGIKNISRREFWGCFSKAQ